MRIKKTQGLTYSETIRFHGHNGPFLALGYKLGRFLVKKLKPKGIMDLKITVQTRFEKPFTCLIDGLQCSTFATLGKGNMIIKNSRNTMITVIVEKNNKFCRIQITKETINRCLEAKDLEKAANRIFRTSIKSLWKVE